MIKYYLLLLIIACSSSTQAQKINFTYDDAGNQVSRVLSLETGKKTDAPSKEIIAVKEEELQKFFPEDVISYYPNPVREELYLKWELADDNYVKALHVYNFTGQVLKSYSHSGNDNSQTIPFQSYPCNQTV